MVPNCWYAVAESAEIKSDKPRRLKRLGEELVFWRDAAGAIAVFHDRCPHRSASLARGKIIQGELECPFHGFRYNAAGALTLAPANGRGGAKPDGIRCGRIESREAEGFIWLWKGDARDQYPPLPWFDNLQDHSWASFQAHWDTDYTRAIEGMLDVSHLPFVHARTIGRGNRTLVNGPYTTLEDGKVRVWVTNQPDAGLPAARPTELPPPEAPPSLSFNFPNLWQLQISPQMRIVNAIVPIDDENVVIYVRNYLRLKKVRRLEKAMCHVLNLANRYILHEDYAVTRSQRPKKSGLDIGENFIPADRPIALYLRERRDRIRAEEQRQSKS